MSMCLKPGYGMATPTFTPLCTLPVEHAGSCNWAERMAAQRSEAD